MKLCLSQSTAHGIAHIGNEQHTFGKYLWLCLTIITLIFFGGHTYLLYTQLLDEQVFISTHPEAVPFIQPDIVLCSERMFARDFINNPPKDEYEFMLNVSKKVQEFDGLYQKTRFKSSKIIWDSLNLHQLFKAFYHRKNELFLNISCNVVGVDISVLKVEMNIAHFACYRIPADICKLDSPFNSLIIKLYIHIYGKHVETKNSLNINVNNRSLDSYLFIQKDYTDEVADGVHIYFVQPNEAVHERTKRVTASANTQTDIRIKSIKYVRQSNNRNQCQKIVKYDQFFNLLEEDIGKNYLNFTEHCLCIYKQFQLILHKAFHCVSTQFPIPVNLGRNFTFCGDLKRQNKVMINLYSSMRFRNLFQRRRLVNMCKGTVPCTSVKHNTYVNYNSWPWLPTLTRLLSVDIPEKLDREPSNCSSPGLVEAVEDSLRNPNDIELWRKNFIKVSISSDEFMSTEVVESPSYSLKNFLSDVGGIMGFYLGASLLTWCELFRLVYYLVLYKKVDKNKDIEANPVRCSHA